jgi:hypothetical protein
VTPQCDPALCDIHDGLISRAYIQAMGKLSLSSKKVGAARKAKASPGRASERAARPLQAQAAL